MYEPGSPSASDRVRKTFDEQLALQCGEGVDFIIGETFSWLGEALIAVERAKTTGLPVMVTICFENKDETADGKSAEEAAKALIDSGADIVGMNCLRSPEHTLPSMEKMRKAVSGYLACQPVAYRTPKDKPDFTSLPEFPYALDPLQLTRKDMGDYAVKAKEIGINYIGSCCGSVAMHVRAMAQALGKLTDDTRTWKKGGEKAMSASSKIKLEDLSRAIAEGQLKELPLVLKADVQGSIEALGDQLMKIPQEKIKLRIIRSGAGAITEGDVLLAAASNAVVIGFNVRPERKAAEVAERDRVEIRLYTVIYDAVEEMKKALEGLLEPTIREVRLGSAEVREAFRISKIGTIAGCYVVDGRVNRNAQVRLLRDNVVIHTGKVSSLKRFKEDASEVKAGTECGIGIANYNDIKPGDVIEFFTTEKVKETLQ
jgi:hypothetical protein